jgi:hypothetical protein
VTSPEDWYRVSNHQVRKFGGKRDKARENEGRKQEKEYRGGTTRDQGRRNKGANSSCKGRQQGMGARRSILTLNRQGHVNQI